MRLCRPRAWVCLVIAHLEFRQWVLAAKACPAIAWPCAAAVVLLEYKSRRSSSSRQANRSGPRQISCQTPFPHSSADRLHCPSRFPQADTCAPSYSGAKRKLANLARDSATEGMQLRILEQPPAKSISYTPDCKVVFLVIVTTSIRVSCGDWTALMRTSVFVCIFRPKARKWAVSVGAPSPHDVARFCVGRRGSPSS
jgi:hypothetical protein